MPFDRRGFLLRASGRHRPVTLACGRLYVRYVDAIGAGQVAEFRRAVEEEIASASEVRLVEREWLSRDDFRRTLENILSGRA
jgi:hypothetical protein